MACNLPTRGRCRSQTSVGSLPAGGHGQGFCLPVPGSGGRHLTGNTVDVNRSQPRARSRDKSRLSMVPGAAQGALSTEERQWIHS
jgi:hypothetical protein